MEPNSNDWGLWRWLLSRDYFKSLRFWGWDVLGCALLAAAVTPADPVSLLVVGVPLVIAWLLIRYAIACHLSKDDQDSRISHSD